MNTTTGTKGLMGALRAYERIQQAAAQAVMEEIAAGCGVVISCDEYSGLERCGEYGLCSACAVQRGPHWGKRVDRLRARLVELCPGLGVDVDVYFQDGDSSNGYCRVTCTVHVESDGDKCQQFTCNAYDIREAIASANSKLDEGWADLIRQDAGRAEVKK